jgi:CheY-like chemotaxis protein
VTLKLLVVDDLRSFLELETTFLRRADCRILTATTGLEAIKVARESCPDLVLLDVEMPLMNGIEAARIFKATPSLAKIPLVVISSTTRREEALAAGACEFVQKPIDENQFLSLVMRHVPLKVRLEKRRTLATPCRCERDGSFFDGTVLDLSATGLFLKSKVSLGVGDPVTVTFTLPEAGNDRSIEAQALVVRSTPHGFGLGFTALSEYARWTIQEFVNEAD